MNLDNALQTFIEESRELLGEMEDALLTLESAPLDEDAINAVFRAMHTIKGSAGLFGLEQIVSFTHVAESVMDRVRDGELAVDDKLIALLLACRDHIGSLMDIQVVGGAEPDESVTASGAELADGLREYLGQAPATESGQSKVESGDLTELPPRADSNLAENDSWHISVRFSSDLLRNGYDPLSFVRYLDTLGELIHVATVSDAMPAGEKMDPESCYLGFEVRLAGDVDKAAIESAFEFVQDDCTLTILPPNSHIVDYIDLIQALPEDNVRLGEILLACGSLTERELKEGLSVQEREKNQNGTRNLPQPLGEILVEREVVQPEVVNAALEKQRLNKEAKNRDARAIRVGASKLDELINLVGELVIAGASAEVMAQRSQDRGLMEANSAVGQLVEAIRDSALRLRMVEIGETFNRFRRVVRDVSQELGKKIELVITGAETELDKSVVEKIGDPLMHLVRNAMDHGIESAEERLEKGKPAKGVLRLNAYHDSGSIVVEISDDGRGLDKDRLLAKAMERELVQPSQNLSEQEIYNLIFEPGFSTAEQVTNLSGRGVGMDVVRRNIDALRGAISLHSKPGSGTTVTIRLPLTLAIIDGFLVGVGNAAYVIPLDCVVECMELDPEETESQDYINLRSRVLPFVRLRELFMLKSEPSRRQNIVVIQYAGQRAGLVVDRLLGEHQTVIRPLGKMFGHLQGISGSTILGSGEVALILDVQDLIRVAIQHEYHALKGEGEHGFAEV